MRGDEQTNRAHAEKGNLRHLELESQASDIRCEEDERTD